MTSPAEAIKNEVRELTDVQIRVFRQLTQLSDAQLQDHHRRFERIKALCSELDKLVVCNFTRRRPEEHTGRTLTVE